ncbi:MAG: TetR/AcrR family transcriptional regulator [Chloroflexi bacterium]|uniref:TetR/AcrR family transcriptional regulator n=1 Tax=Candidatus Chlorohelix allophototropha TaxID=3003348 RepID=A0A8T7M1K1_9CHLR|nr:TetR/AcrR family transcriptional regulator [Chloroflexota bacterium]WJW67879.1 TetR/AcrR family transcriptional regulator [Chloroflexota bacterium L227-S17]
MNNNNKSTLIIEGAFRLVEREGTEKLTLEAVAQEAGISKGGLLYHFPSKEALVSGMLRYMGEQFEQKIELAVANDPEPQGRWLRGYIRASLEPDETPQAVYMAITAAVATNRTLLEPLQKANTEWQKRIEESSGDRATATLLRMAADGFWYTEALGFGAMSPELKQEIMELMLKLSKQNSSTENGEN